MTEKDAIGEIRRIAGKMREEICAKCKALQPTFDCIGMDCKTMQQIDATMNYANIALNAQQPDCQKGEFVPDANVLKELNDKQAKEIQRLTKARKRLADAYRKLRDESLRAAARLEVLEKDNDKLSSFCKAILVEIHEFQAHRLTSFKTLKINIERAFPEIKAQAKAALGEKP